MPAGPVAGQGLGNARRESALTMALPQLIEIIPVTESADAVIAVPGSKSITNRAMILAALGLGETVLRGALWSEDTQVMVQALQELGFMVNIQPDPTEASNRNITVYGKGGAVPAGGTEDQPLELYVGNAGTAARFLAAFVCLGAGVYSLDGVPRMRQRPQKALFEALRTLGYRVDSPNDRLPARIHGSGPRPGKCQVGIEESSQFASALLLGARTGGWQVTVTGESQEESPYVALTSKMIGSFPGAGGVFQIEPDASSGSYFWAAASLVPALKFRMVHWPKSGWQVDQAFPGIMAESGLGRELGRTGQGATLPDQVAAVPGGASISRVQDLGDSIMTAIVLAPFARAPVRFTDLGRLRLQECERVVALRTELAKCGARVIEQEDMLTVYPSELRGAVIETYEDHRVAMCFAVLGLRVPGIRIRNPSCVKKTFPNFFQKLAADPPGGLGAAIREAATGRQLSPEELFAD
jgi:3-phosphoshikimate 1-carboxyvinyltransferase